jgi:hypothetical protein
VNAIERAKELDDAAHAREIKKFIPVFVVLLIAAVFSLHLVLTAPRSIVLVPRSVVSKKEQMSPCSVVPGDYFCARH